jgi:hypothetical protein
VNIPFVSSCICSFLMNRRCITDRQCPRCGTRFLIKNLRRNAMYGTIVGCVRKLGSIVTAPGVKTPASELGALRLESPKTPVRKSPLQMVEMACNTKTPIQKSALHQVEVARSPKTPVQKSLLQQVDRACNTKTPVQKSSLQQMEIFHSPKKPKTPSSIKKVNRPQSSETSGSMKTAHKTSHKPRSREKTYVFLTTGLSEDQRVPLT